MAITLNGTTGITTPAIDNQGNLTVDTNTLFVDSANNRVGVGTVLPDGALHVHTGTAGTVSASVQADELVLEGSTETGMTIISPDDQSARIRFTSPSTNTDVGGASIFYRQNINKMSIGTEVAGGVLAIKSGAGTEAITIDSTGAVTMPYQPAFSVNNAPTPQANIAINTVVTITWAGERFDQNADFDLGANSFTAPVTGKYQFNVVIRLDNVDIDADYYIISIVTSNVEYKYIFDPVFVSDPAYFTVNLSVLADLDASDTAYTTIYQGGGAAQTDITGDASYTYFTGYLVA
jgi:hypothetical protein